MKTFYQSSRKFGFVSRTQHSNPGQGRMHTAQFEVQYTKQWATVPPTNLNPGETVAFGPQEAFKAVALKPDVHTMKQPEALLHRLPFSLSLHVYGLFTTCEVKMAGCWPSSFFCVLMDRDKVKANIQPS